MTRSSRAGAMVGLYLAMLLVRPAAGTEPSLTIRRGDPADPAPRVGLSAASNLVAVIERSANPGEWRDWLQVHGSVGGVADLTGESAPAAFYRARIRNRTAGDDWKNVMSGSAGEAFLAEPSNPAGAEPRWIKFAIRLAEPGRVYFQDSTRYPFHYEFARARIPGLQTVSRAEFDAQTLRTNAQSLVLGAVLISPAAAPREIGIQFVGLDPYPREQVLDWFRTVSAVIDAPPGTSMDYLPTFEQAAIARENAGWFEARGVRVTSAGRWVVNDECYSPGWALGRLVFVPGRDLAEAWRSGRLGPDDLLLTDQVPAEVPPLAGIVALEPATPNSHVALLSQAFGIPFVRLADAAVAAAALTWTNRDVLIRAVAQFGGCDVVVAPVEGELAEASKAAIRALRAPAPLRLPGKQVRGGIGLPADPLRPADAGYVGGKAANFGVIRRRIPTNSPAPAVALTFDLWEAYLEQPLADGRTLRNAIRDRLTGFHWPPDMAQVETALADVRRLITDDADFGTHQQSALVDLLRQAGFDPLRNIRFRSSTNVEDSDEFSGAGLYDSYSGCLADELDADTTGPSACDSTEPRERGVFRALRRVYASFYNPNAFLERLRHGVDESAVGMAVLVHPSVPDAFELANGVATMRVTRGGGRYRSGTIVSQAGAVSVANPDSAAVPESTSFSQFGATPLLSVDTRSSLVPLGGTVMTWETDYRRLLALLDTVALGYEAEFPAKTDLVLDFEFKRLAPDGRLEVKQVREVPQPPARTFTPWLLNVTGDFEVLQGEHGDLVALHRLKSRWRWAVRNMELTDAELAHSPLLRVAAEWRDAGLPVVLDAAPAGLPGYGWSSGADVLTEKWWWGDGTARRDYQWRTTRLRQRSAAEGPLLVPGDQPMELTVTYATPQPTLAWSPDLQTQVSSNVVRETVRVVAVQPVSAGSLRQDRVLSTRSAKLAVRTSFWWPAPPRGPTAGYTAPLQAWIESTITGLVSRPIVLRSPWAQTYHPGHHNFIEEFLFEPGLDPDLPADLRAELRAANCRAILLSAEPWDGSAATGWVWGDDGRFRRL